MNKEQLFDKYGINSSHDVWDNSVDNWMSVEIYREMHGGNLPGQDDASTKYILDFLDKTKDKVWMPAFMTRQPRWGSFFLTAKRLVYKLHETILEEINASQ